MSERLKPKNNKELFEEEIAKCAGILNEKTKEQSLFTPEQIEVLWISAVLRECEKTLINIEKNIEKMELDEFEMSQLQKLQNEFNDLKSEISADFKIYWKLENEKLIEKVKSFIEKLKEYLKDF